MVDFATDFRQGDPDLEIAALDFAVFLGPSSISAPADFSDVSGDLAALPAGLIPIGNLDKAAAVKLTNKMNSTPVETYGEQTATRIIRKSRDVSAAFTMQQTGMAQLGAYWGQDFSSVTADPTTGEVHLVISETAFNIEYACVIIGFDGSPGAEKYTIFDGPRVTLMDSGDIGTGDDKIMTYPATMQFLKGKAAGYAIRQSFAGKGWKAVAAAAGFKPPVTGITVAPATKTLAAAATQQLTVTDSNGTNVTALATYSSGTPAKATVNSAGLITGVATGSSTITATYATFTGTCAVTVS